ncbi:hypothetical protein [Rubeoparvulum massiliense]|nr:hypothetical protein [Rubeoparvulum massiliense]
MYTAIHAWFVVEIASITHVLTEQGGSMPIFRSTTKADCIFTRRTMHR